MERVVDGLASQGAPETGVPAKKIGEVLSLKPEPYFDKRMTIRDCYEILKKGKMCLPIRDAGKIVGVIDGSSLRKNFVAQGLDKDNSCIKCLRHDFFELPADSKLSLVEKAFEENSYVVLTDRVEDQIVAVYVVTVEDLLLTLEDKMQLII